MTNTLAAGVAWLKAHPTRKNVPGASYRIGYGWSWSQLCGSAVRDAIGSNKNFGTANIARAASHIVSESRTGIPDGAVGWFSLGSAGHVVFFSGGKPVMASKYVTSLFPDAQALGTCSSIAEYEKRSGGKWIGYSLDYGGDRFAGTSTASTGTTTAVTKPLKRKAKTMFLWYCTDNNGGLWTLVDTERYIYNQTRSQTTANTWADLYADGQARTIQPANLAQGLTGYTSAAWPFPKTVAAAATTVNLAASDRALLQQIAAKIIPTKAVTTSTTTLS
jgi:hypothetical protein